MEVRPRASRPLFLSSARIQDHEGRSATHRDLGNLFLSAVWLLWTCGKTHSVLQEQHVLPVLVAQRTNTVLIRHNRGMGPDLKTPEHKCGTRVTRVQCDCRTERLPMLAFQTSESQPPLNSQTSLLALLSSGRTGNGAPVAQLQFLHLYIA